jgi:hypothetical protein
MIATSINGCPQLLAAQLLEELAFYAEHTGKCWIAKKNVLHRYLH